MKKVLVLVLVLAVASMASATYSNLTFTLSGPSTVAQGTEFTVNVKVTGLEAGDTLGQLDQVALNVGGVAHTNGVITLASTFGVAQSATTNWSNLSLVTTAYPGVVNNGTVFSFKVTSGAVAGNITYSMSNLGEGTYAGTQLGNDAYPGYDLGSISYVGGTTTVVPEPITVALLGLGGLFLRRKAN